VYLASLAPQNLLHGTYFGAHRGGRGRGLPPLKSVRNQTEQKRKAKSEKQREETDKTKVMDGG
jgi:hypothetical protein